MQSGLKVNLHTLSRTLDYMLNGSTDTISLFHFFLRDKKGKKRSTQVIYQINPQPSTYNYNSIYKKLGSACSASHPDASYSTSKQHFHNLQEIQHTQQITFPRAQNQDKELVLIQTEHTKTEKIYNNVKQTFIKGKMGKPPWKSQL